MWREIAAHRHRCRRVPPHPQLRRGAVADALGAGARGCGRSAWLLAGVGVGSAAFSCGSAFSGVLPTAPGHYPTCAIASAAASSAATPAADGGPQRSASPSTVSVLAAPRRHRSGRCGLRPRGRGRTARRLFDSGSFFGVGVPEALVVAVLGWFLLGPEELYKLAKQAGGWLGELRTFVGQAARQYETALDDESTRKAIEGIRETQRTISEVSSSWRSVADSLRDPLALGSTLEQTYSKYAPTSESKPDSKELDKKGSAVDSSKTKSAAAVSETYPDLDIADAEDAGDAETTFLQELEAKRAASRESVEDLWFSGSQADESNKQEDDAGKPKDVEGYLKRLDTRLKDLDSMAARLEDLRSGILEDRIAIKEALQATAAASAVAAPEEAEEDRPSGRSAATTETKLENKLQAKAETKAEAEEVEAATQKVG
mmetsp:Transcript_48667/g.122808  ORF Transcript_48667/g.122808 Transcript_48667/m.122808 type:complete len:430 (-) Transcript_48667:47-1336(-)